MVIVEWCYRDGDGATGMVMVLMGDGDGANGRW